MDRLSRLRVLLIIFLLCQVAFPACFVASAQEVDEYSGLDILFLIDQSGSMSDSDAVLTTPSIGDGGPVDSAFYAIQYAAGWMGRDRLNVHNTATYRMAVVCFGSDAEALAFSAPQGTTHWQEIAPNSKEEWTKLYDELKQTLDPGEASRSDSAETNHLAAFQKAREVFDDLPRDESHRHRAIVLLTDGQPFLDVEGFSVAEHLLAVAGYVEASFSYLDYATFVIIPAGLDDPWPNRAAPYWEAISHNQVGRVRSSSDFGERVHDILLKLTADFPTDRAVENLVPVSNELIVPPYLASVTLTFFMPEKGRQPQVTINGRVPNPQKDEGIFLEINGDSIYTYRILMPPPGRWQLDAEALDAAANVRLQRIAVGGRLDSPVGSQAQYVEVQVLYTLLDDRDWPFQSYQDPLYELAITAEVQTPSGSSDTVPLEVLPGGSYAGSFVPVDAGLYTIHILAESHDIEGNSVVLFEDMAPEEVTVEPTRLLWLHIVAPSDSKQLTSGLLPWDRNALVLEVEVVDEGGEPVEATQAFVDQTSSALNVRLLDGHGKDYSDALTLALTDAPGLYRAETMDLDVGEYDLTVQAQTALRDGFMYQLAEDSIHISRVRHPAHVPIAIGLAGSAVASSGLLIFRHRRRLKRSEMGSIAARPVISDENGMRGLEELEPVASDEEPPESTVSPSKSEPVPAHLVAAKSGPVTARNYDPAIVRDLLLAAFTAQELCRLFLYTSNQELRPLRQEFSPNDGLTVMVDRTVEYCLKRDLLEGLLREAQQANPRMYTQFEHRLLGQSE